MCSLHILATEDYLQRHSYLISPITGNSLNTGTNSSSGQ